MKLSDVWQTIDSDMKMAAGAYAIGLLPETDPLYPAVMEQRAARLAELEGMLGDPQHVVPDGYYWFRFADGDRYEPVKVTANWFVRFDGEGSHEITPDMADRFVAIEPPAEPTSPAAGAARAVYKAARTRP